MFKEPLLWAYFYIHLAFICHLLFFSRISSTFSIFCWGMGWCVHQPAFSNICSLCMCTCVCENSQVRKKQKSYIRYIRKYSEFYLRPGYAAANPSSSRWASSGRIYHRRFPGAQRITLGNTHISVIHLLNALEVRTAKSIAPLLT